MKAESLELKIEEDVLSFLSMPQFRKEIEGAKDYFYNYIEQGDMNRDLQMDFNSWLIYDYRLQDGKTFLEKYYHTEKEHLSEEEKCFIQNQLNAYLSIYEIYEIQGDNVRIRDIFVKEEYFIPLDNIDDAKTKELVLARVMENGGQYRLTGNKQYIPGIFKSTMERNIYEYYEDYKNKNRFGTWKTFLRDHSELLYKYLGIIEELLIRQEEEDDERYRVWQSVYLIKDTRNIKQMLLAYDQIELDGEDRGSCYFKLMSNKKILGELVLKNNRLELECVSENDRKTAKKFIEKILGENGKHYKDEIFSIEDLV